MHLIIYGVGVVIFMCFVVILVLVLVFYFLLGFLGVRLGGFYGPMPYVLGVLYWVLS